MLRPAAMRQNPRVERFWQAYLESLQSDSRVPESYECWYFGGRKSAKKLAGLVRSGHKTATSALAWELEAKGFGLPSRGDLVVVTDFDGDPSCVIEITEARIIPFSEIIDEQFAMDYGEGAKSLDEWKTGSWEHFTAACREIGRSPSEAMPIACQRFRVVYPERE